MKRNYMLLIVLFFVMLVKVRDNNTETFKIDGVKYFVSINGEKASSFPEMGSYDVTMECHGADYNWNYEEWVAELYNISGNAYCNIAFNDKEHSNLSKYIRNLIPFGKTTVSSTSNNDNSTLEMVDNDYRYRGINPNNYIKFNGELWRIIGVFDQKTHGQSSENLVKIIRNSSLGSISWDVSSFCIDSGGSSGCHYYNAENNYADSTIYELLNDEYYNSKSTNCVMGIDRDVQHEGVSQTFIRKCDFTTIGIKEPYKSMVKKVTWYLGGYQSSNLKSANAYTYERSSSNQYYYHQNNWWGDTNDKTVQNYIGLMYASDYGYAAPSTCTERMSSYSETGCADSNWLKSNISEWTLMHSTDYFVDVFGIDNQGNLAEYNGDSDLDVRPVLYLNSDVFIYRGTGTMVDPYIIGM